MAPLYKPRLQRLQFGLRGLLVMVALVAVSLAWWVVRANDRGIETITITLTESAPNLLRDKRAVISDRATIRRILSWFPDYDRKLSAGRVGNPTMGWDGYGRIEFFRHAQAIDFVRIEFDGSHWQTQLPEEDDPRDLSPELNQFLRQLFSSSTRKPTGDP